MGGRLRAPGLLILVLLVASLMLPAASFAQSDGAPGEAQQGAASQSGDAGAEAGAEGEGDGADADAVAEDEGGAGGADADAADAGAEDADAGDAEADAAGDEGDAAEGEGAGQQLAPTSSGTATIDLSEANPTTGTGWSFNSSTNVFTINAGANVTVQGNTTGRRVEVAGDANVTLNNAHINVSATSSTAFDIISGTTNITLTGDNLLKSGSNSAGLHVPAGTTLTINNHSTGTLTATGGNGNDGHEGAAGIGGTAAHMASSVGTINIQGGTITATGGGGGTGIGVGSEGSGGAINISGGVVTAIGGYDSHEQVGAPGMGLADPDHVVDYQIPITISGGVVVAKGVGTVWPDDDTMPDILAGADNDTNIIVSGGSLNVGGIQPRPVTDASRKNEGWMNTITVGAPGVGDGKTVSDIKIDGSITYGSDGLKTTDGSKLYLWLSAPAGTVSQQVQLKVDGTVYGASYGRINNDYNFAALRTDSGLEVSGNNAKDPSYVDWSDGTLTFKKPNSGGYFVSLTDGAASTSANIAVVGSGSYAITLSDVNIDASSNQLGQSISAFDITDSAKVDLTLAGTNVLQSGVNSAGLHVNNAASLTITAASTGSLEATGGSRDDWNGGAGIGGGNGLGNGSITIAGGTVTAIGGGGSAGIGTGPRFEGGNSSITIAGGKVTATGGSGGADIGIGSTTNDNAATITISGGTVITNGSRGETNAAIVAQTGNASGGSVTITGGSIKAGAIFPAPTNAASSRSAANSGSLETASFSLAPLDAASSGSPVYLNTLTLGDPAAAAGLAVTAGSIDGVPCTQDGVNGYGINDVATADGGKLYLWLTANAADNAEVQLTVNNFNYKAAYKRQANNDNTVTLARQSLGVSDPASSTGGLPKTGDSIAWAVALVGALAAAAITLLVVSRRLRRHPQRHARRSCDKR
jgi:LPXTG-motif cell wall-anchored protein